MDLTASGSRHGTLIRKYLSPLTLIGDPRIDHAFFKLNLCRDLFPGFCHCLNAAAQELPADISRFSLEIPALARVIGKIQAVSLLRTAEQKSHPADIRSRHRRECCLDRTVPDLVRRLGTVDQRTVAHGISRAGSGLEVQPVCPFADDLALGQPFAAVYDAPLIVDPCRMCGIHHVVIAGALRFCRQRISFTCGK